MLNASVICLRLQTLGEVSSVAYKLKERTKRKHYTIVVVRVFVDGQIGNSRPCVGCQFWLEVAHSLGVNIKIKHINEERKLIKYDGVSTQVPYIVPM